MVEASADDRAARHDRRILLIDDEQEVLRAVSALLTLSGYEVDCAESSEQALDLLDCRAYALVITDLSLKAGNSLGGYRIVDTVHRRLPRTRVALLTGRGSADVEAEALRLGADRVFSKSQSMKEIAVAVDGLIGSAGRESEET
jgi:DNA-binding response OmpR family regulator